jgi:hypothetical protein
MRFFATPRPPGAFGVRQLAAAFENGPMCPYFKDSLESGSKRPKASRLQKLCGPKQDADAPNIERETQ